MASLMSLSLTTSWLMISPIAVGTIIHVTYLRIVVDAGAQLGVDEREAGRLLGELRRVRLASHLASP